MAKFQKSTRNVLDEYARRSAEAFDARTTKIVRKLYEEKYGPSGTYFVRPVWASLADASDDLNMDIFALDVSADLRDLLTGRLADFEAALDERLRSAVRTEVVVFRSGRLLLAATMLDCVDPEAFKLVGWGNDRPVYIAPASSVLKALL